MLAMSDEVLDKRDTFNDIRQFSTTYRLVLRH